MFGATALNRRTQENMTMITYRNTLGAACLLLTPTIVACTANTDVAALDQPLSGTDASVTPSVIEGNPTCEDLGLGSLFDEKKDCPACDGDYIFEDGVHKATVTKNGLYFDWASTMSVDVVIVKGGDNANIYNYQPGESLGDTGLSAPINPNTQIPFGLSHIDFCYDYEVEVSKTADTAYDRSYGWDIDKTSPNSQLLLSLGQTFINAYTVTLSVTGWSDSNWAVAGTITVHNPAHVSALVTDVIDELDGSPLPVNCPVSFPYTMASGETFQCTYGATLTSAQDGTNVATATTQGLVGEGSGSAAVSFAGATVNGIDECVDVDDDQYGPLGQACVGQTLVFNYQQPIGAYGECGLYSFDNTASFIAVDTNATGSDSHSVAVEVPCVSGCSLTPGYWKTHSLFGPAPYDANWANLPSGADTPFFLSGQSYHQVLWTAPMGNVYYILARAYIAAYLNGLNGADTSAITAELTAAMKLLSTYSPAEIGLMRGKNGKQLRAEIVALADTLDQYNNGIIGPGHCSE